MVMATSTNTFRLPIAPRAKVSPRKISAEELKKRPEYVPDNVTNWEDSWLGDPTDEAIEHCEKLPLVAPMRPVDEHGEVIDPSLPPDVTLLTGEELGRLHAQMVAMIEWLEWKVAEADSRAATAEAFLEHTKAEVRLRKSGTVSDKAAKTLNDQRVVNAEVSFISFNAKARLLKGRVRGYDKVASALSREMSRREAELKRLPT